MEINGINYEMLDADSRAIASIGYDAESKTLCIIFRGTEQTAYVYSNVSYQRNTAMNYAQSLGKLFHNIRANVTTFPFEKFSV